MRRLFILIVLLSACAQRKTASETLPPTPPPPSPQVTTATVAPSVRLASDAELEKADGLVFRLKSGAAPAAPVERVELGAASPLEPAEAAKLLARLPPLVTKEGDVKDFALRESSLPPPKTGTVIKQPFPPPIIDLRRLPAPAGPAEVVRVRPEGEVPIAPDLSVSFSKPVLPDSVKAALSPIVPGQWRWIGNKTLLFSPEKRFPMATEYTATVAGKSWTFATPPPSVTRFWPQGGPAPLSPLMIATFDQRIDPAAVLASISVVAGGKKVSLELGELPEPAAMGDALAFRATDAFPPDTEVRVSIGPGTPSVEGPRKTPKAQTYTFRTYGALKLAGHRCGWEDRCPPYTPFNIWFTNPIDDQTFDPSMVRASPEIPNLQVTAGGTHLYIHGSTKPRTKYKITISSELPDVFGQKLGAEQTVSFDVGSAEASLNGAGDTSIVLDPLAPPAYSVWSTNYPKLLLRVYEVTPEQFSEYIRTAGEEKRAPPGRKIHDGVLQVAGPADELVETRVDLARFLKNGAGQLIIDVRPTERKGNYLPFVRRWVQATKIGLDGFADAEAIWVWATELATGQPLAGVSLEIRPHQLRAETDARGLAKLDLPAVAPQGTGVLIARRGNDLAILPELEWDYQGKSTWAAQTREPASSWFVFNDRGLYRPGESARIKGFLRRIEWKKGGDVAAVPAAVQSVDWKLRDSHGNDVKSGSAKLTPLGGFDLTVEFPGTINLGSAPLELRAGGSPHMHWIQIQEFRRPEFEVTASVSEGPHLVGQTATAHAHAAYYAGGGLANAATTWNISSSPASFTPPNRGDFTFGSWIPWWGPMRHSPRSGSGKTEMFQGLTDAAGDHHLAIELAGVKPPRPSTINAEVTVTDVNRQTFSASTSFLVHPSASYVGVRVKEPFVRAGQPIRVETITVDLDGGAIPGRAVDVRVVRLQWAQKKGRWVEEELDEERCRLTSTAEPVACEISPKEGGRHRVTARVSDDRGRPNESELYVWVAGEKSIPQRGLESEQVELIPDKREYRAGETAQILVRAPFVPARGLLSVRRSGILSAEALEMKEATAIVAVKILEEYVPNVIVDVDLSGAAPRTDDEGNIAPSLPKRPAFASGSLSLSVPPFARELSLSVKPKETRLEPGASTSVEVVVTGADKKPIAGAEVVVVIADESVLALTNYRIPDPLEVFYPPRHDDTREYHSRAHVLLGRPADLATAKPPPPPPAPPPGASGRFDKAKKVIRLESLAIEGKETNDGAAPIELRSDFNPLALFAPQLSTDAAGRVNVQVKLPDNLTRYRVSAVAVSGAKYFGRGESSITARKALMVRPSAPRFLNFGDHFELPVVIQNQTDRPFEALVAVRASNAELISGQGRRVRVPAEDRVEVRFPTRTLKPGTARFQFAGAAGPLADAAEVSLPVWTPATTEAFATYGELDSGAVFQPVAMPADVQPAFGGLEISVASTQLQALTDAVVHLVNYPFECSEQIASRIIAIAALKDVLNAFEAEGLPPPKQLIAAVDRDLERLQGMQNYDGSFGFWTRDRGVWPFNSIHATHAMARAKEKGFKVPEEMLAKAHHFLKIIEGRYTAEYGTEIRRVLTAYALYVRHLLDDRDLARARKLIAEWGGVEKTPIEALGWLYPVLSGDPASATELAAMRKFFGNRVTETAGTAHFTTAYSDGAHLLLHSDRRADGLILYGLIGDQPGSDLIPKIVRGLLAHRVKGHWSSTQENVWVLLALDRYFATYEKTPPNFAARVWLGKKFAGEQRFRGRTTETQQIDIPMRFLVELASSRGEESLAIAKDGPGRLYYRVGLRYAPISLRLDAADHGFTIERRYEPVSDPSEVHRDRDGIWRVRAGAKVRVRVTIVAPTRRYHVALVDPLPAGLEALNPALAVTERVPEEETPRDWWYRRTWYEHQNLRDERAEAFTSLLWEGVHEYVYVARATTPGDYVVPPAKAEEMYAPETFGRSSSDRVVIE